MDFLAISSLYCQGVIKISMFLEMLGRIFKVLPKNKHRLFMLLLRKLFIFLITQKLYLSDLSLAKSKIRGVKFVLGRNMSEKEESEEATSQENEIEWGESFIGQDVCGSKYNDDPFDGMDNKRDAWTEMKKKIELKAKEKGKNIKDLEKGKWP